MHLVPARVPTHLIPTLLPTRTPLSFRMRGLQNGVFAPAAVWRKWLLLLAIVVALYFSEHAFA